MASVHEVSGNFGRLFRSKCRDSAHKFSNGIFEKMHGSSRSDFGSRFVEMCMLMTEALVKRQSALKLSGEIDLLQAPALRVALQEKAESKCPVLIIDLSEVSFMDSSGLSELIAYEQAARAFGGKLFIVGPRPEIRQLFSLAHLDGFFRIFDSTEAALRTLTG